MIAKIVKGSNFKGVVSYILDKEKDSPRRTNIA